MKKVEFELSNSFKSYIQQYNPKGMITISMNGGGVSMFGSSFTTEDLEIIRNAIDIFLLKKEGTNHIIHF